MTQDNAPNHLPALASIALRHPEKTSFLGQVFHHTTNSYKLVWFLAFLSLLKRSDRRALPLGDLFTEMAVASWHPVCLFRLSLGRQDKLQDVILEIQQSSGLSPNATPDAIRSFVEGSAAAQAMLDCFKRFVPTRFLTPWFGNELRGVRDTFKDAKIKTLARDSQKTPFPSLYYFEGNGVRQFIKTNESWRVFLMENLGIVESFADHPLAIYLQARNPNVPGVLNKLHAPTARQLTAARDFWRVVQADFEKAGKPAEFRDIYSERQLCDNSFSIDHFLPWSFVVHDLLWNLTPVEQATNSSKNDILPDLDVYLPRLAKLHFGAIQVAQKRPKLLEDYTDCFKLDFARLVALGENGFAAKYRDVILPQAQIAINQGFQSGWRMRRPVFAIGHRPTTARDAHQDEFSGVAVEKPTPEKNIEFCPIESRRTPGGNWLPFFSLKVAAGGFLGNAAPEPEGWVDVVKYGFSKRLSQGMFVTQVVGESMHPTIRDGSFCVFRSPVEGTRQGRIVLVQKRDMADPDTGGAYTVKRYRSTKSNDEDSWRHESVQLIPDNPDRARFPVMMFTPNDDADLCVIAEFIEMLALVT